MKKHKKILIVIFVVLVLGGIGFGGYKYYEHYQDNRMNNENWLKNHISLEANSEGVYEVKTDEDMSIFNLAYQNVIEDKINDLKENDYSLENPLIIYPVFFLCLNFISSNRCNNIYSVNTT